eukprot:XP_765454.1 hypothetical protein [Theileria parva strain Muguga]
MFLLNNDVLEVPKDGEWIICGDSGEDSKWYTHESGKWMYNSEEHVYFHIESQKIVPDLAYFEAKNEENHPDDYQDGVDLQYQDELGDPNQSEIDLENESEEEISMDFNKDLIAGTESRMGNLDSKIENEDRFITRESMSIQKLTNSDALCYFSGVFDGHYGPKCAEYIVRHLKNNVLTVFLQNIKTYSTLKKRKLFTKANLSCSINEFPVQTDNRSRVVDNRDHKDGTQKDYSTIKRLNELSDEVFVFIHSISKAIEIIDNNFCSYAQKKSIFDGSTLNVAFFFGPDSFGSLKLILANLGDSRSILCVREGNKYVAKDLTKEHKPNDKLERERILKNNGLVEYLQGCWRAILRKPDGNVCAISTSRTVGDYIFKTPDSIVGSQPDLYVHDVDFDDHIFLVQCTDGVTDALSSQEIVDTVVDCIKLGYDPKTAAKKVVNKAEDRGSSDDKTCNIIYFGWHKNLFSKLSPETGEGEKEVESEELKQEEEDIF